MNGIGIKQDHIQTNANFRCKQTQESLDENGCNVNVIRGNQNQEQ